MLSAALLSARGGASYSRAAVNAAPAFAESIRPGVAWPAAMCVATAALSLSGCQRCGEARQCERPAAGETAREASSARLAERPRAAPHDALAAARNPLAIDPTDYDFSRNPKLLVRVRENVFGYFRFINLPFSRDVCRRFKPWLQSRPTVNLHGDAHLENYVVTDVGRGLSDFDDSSAGPAVIDLVRFGTSIFIAARLRGWSAERERLLERFLAGYRDALQDAQTKGPLPRYVARVRAHLQQDRRAFLRFAESLMEPLPAAERADIGTSYGRYERLMQQEKPRMRPGFLRPKRIGRNSAGFGSALDRKYLIRIEGPTAALEDDVILEAKEVRDLSAIECVYARSSGGAFRILVAHARIAEVTDQFLAQVPRAPDSAPAEPSFWIHSWRPLYLELSIESEPRSPEELAEIVYDVGLQLGRGHTRKIAAPLDSQLRRAQLQCVEELDSQIKRAVAEMSAATYEGWAHFRREVAARP